MTNTLGSHGVTWGHMGSRGVTWGHMGSRGVTCAHREELELLRLGVVVHIEAFAEEQGPATFWGGWR
eukprot:7021532-Prymnesium_polylepis.1